MIINWHSQQYKVKSDLIFSKFLVNISYSNATLQPFLFH